MDPDDFFCRKCRRLKSKCICHKKSVAEKNLEIFREFCDDEDLKPLFQGDYEVVDFRESGIQTIPSVSVDSLPVSQNLKEALRLKGIDHLFEFQKKAINLIKKRRNVIIAAPTGMGKTEAFALPLVELAHEGGSGIIVYPTKALARDQLEKIRYYARFHCVEAVRFDGDTESHDRFKVFRGEADIILTNPDMIDYHLRNTPEFRDFVRKVEIIVFDELHAYSGFLGSNIYWLMKRIERFSNPQIVGSSATIANPVEFGRLLFDREFDVVRSDGRKKSQKLMMAYGDFYQTVRQIASRMRGRKILIFGNSYKVVEAVAWMLERSGIKCLVHKAGLPKRVREKVENQFREGNVNVLVSTSTLELGIDIGDVDFVISELTPYPVFLQRAGRAGRNEKSGLGILVLREESAIGEYYRKNSEEYYREKMVCYAERDNDVVMKYHIHSMALEMPIRKNEIERKYAEKLLNDGLLIDAGDFYIAGINKSGFSMRGAGKRVKIIYDGAIIGERALPIAIRELHPGAIFIHNKKRFVVESLDLKKMIACVHESDKEYLTSSLHTIIPRIIRVSNARERPVNAIYCQMEMTIAVNGYIVRHAFDERRKKVRYLDSPVSYSFTTKGFVFTCPFPEKLEYQDFFAGSFHALEHVLIETSDAVTGGGSNVIGGISTPDGYIFVYDGTEGGNGMSRLLFNRIERAFHISLSVLEDCDCRRTDGCPKCTYSYQCGNNNQPLNRIGASDILRKILSGKTRKTDFSLFEEVRDFVYYP